MPITFYEVIWIFMIYAFLGWCTEVAYAALELKQFVNRGFLNGPVCPIYGFGVLVVLVILTPLKKNFLLLFLGSVILTSVIEFITGFLLEKIFHNQWWDYSDENFNICGYVCLKFSILWGIGCTLVMDVIHPTIDKFIKFMPKILGMILLVFFCITFVVDIVITVCAILKFNERLKLIDETAAKLKVVSNEIGENIYESVSVALEKGEDVKSVVSEKREDFTESIKMTMAEKREELVENLGNRKSTVIGKKELQTDQRTEKNELQKEIQTKQKAERNRLQKEYNKLLEHKSFVTKRLMKAFPRMRSRAYQEALIRWKNHRNEKM